MKVKHLKEALHGLDDNEQVMITFFLKSHADEMIAEDDQRELSFTEWNMAVSRYERNEHLDQDACNVYAEAVRSVINERVIK